MQICRLNSAYKNLFTIQPFYHSTLNLNYMQKIILSSVKFVIALMVIIFTTRVQAALISSTATGGQWIASSTWVGGVVPGAGDDVVVVNGASVSIGVAAACKSLNIGGGNQSSSVIISLTNSLTVYGNITINPTTLNGAYKTINVGAGSLTCVDLIMVNSGGNTRINELLVSTGTVTVTGNITMGATAVRNVISFSDAGTLNLGGSISGGDLNAGTGVVNYNGTSPQTVVMNGNYVYYDLHLNNTATATLGLGITATRVLGDIKVLTGVFNNGGYAIAGNAGKIFEIADGATLELDGTTSAFPSVFTPVLGANSTVEYKGTGNQTIKDIDAPGYGNLVLSTGGIKTVAAVVLPNPAGLDIQGDVILNSGISVNARAYVHNVGGDWINNGADVTGNNTINFDGSSPQLVSGAATNQAFYKVMVSNNSILTSNCDFVAINSTLVINSGCQFIIPAGKEVTATGNITNSAGVTGLIIQSNSGGTGSLIHPNLNVPATVQRYVGAANWSVWNNGWHFLSSPVASQPISGSWTPSGAGNDYDFYAWDEPSQTWLNFKTTPFATVNPGTNFVVGRGYDVAYQVTGTKEFSGNLNASNVIRSGLTVTPAVNDHWHLLGNPYPCALTWLTGWTYNNIGAVCQVWNESMSSYTSIIAGGSIPSMNGFMVEALVNNASITIPKTARTHSTTPWYKNLSVLTNIKLTAWDEDKKTGKESIIMLDPNSTTAFDPEYDGHFLPDFAPKFYSLAGDDKLSVNTLPELGNDITVPFVFEKNTSDNFTIELTTDQVVPDLDIYLKDNKTGVLTNLSQNPVYNFSSAEGDDMNRFVLQFKSSTTGTGRQIVSNDMEIYSANNFVYINQSNIQSGTVNLFSLSGQIIASFELTATPSQNISLPHLAPGIYIINVTTKLGTYNAKIVIK